MTGLTISMHNLNLQLQAAHLHQRFSRDVNRHWLLRVKGRLLLQETPCEHTRCVLPIGRLSSSMLTCRHLEQVCAAPIALHLPQARGCSEDLEAFLTLS